MSRFRRSPVLRTAGWSSRLAYALLLAILSVSVLLLAAGADSAVRASGLRVWALVGAGMFAIAPPNVLLPDPNVRVLQLLNWDPTRLLRYQLRRLAPVILLFLVPAGLMAIGDVTRPVEGLVRTGGALAQCAILLVGTALDSFLHFATLGARSQAWQEGRAGQWYARGVEERGHGVSLPRGLVPALFATTRCFALAIVAVVTTAAAAQAGATLLSWVPGVLLFGWVVLRLARGRHAFDRHFYQTTAFYGEVLGGQTTTRVDREPVPYEALYWVPNRWRSAVWASLRQLDRQLPLGRLVAIGHVGLWLFCIRGVGSAIIAAYLLLLFTGQVAASGLLGRRRAAPVPFQLSLQSVADWVGTRTFVNLRWLGPHVASLGLVALFDDTYGLGWIGVWAGVHVALSVGAAVVVTLGVEGLVRWSTR